MAYVCTNAKRALFGRQVGYVEAARRSGSDGVPRPLAGLRRTDAGAVLRQIARRLRPLGQTKIGQEWPVVAIDQNIPWLEIAVHNAPEFVQRVQGAGYLLQVKGGAVVGKRSLAQDLGQAL